MVKSVMRAAEEKRNQKRAELNEMLELRKSGYADLLRKEILLHKQV